MSQEHQPHRQSAERDTANLEAAAAERLRELELTPEARSEHSSEQAKQVERARETINHHEDEPEPAAAAEAAKPAQVVHQLLDRAQNYRDTMSSLQRKLTPAGRRFSLFIHTPAVDKASEILEGTVMRPSVALGAGVTGLIVGGFFYYFARTYGYSLRGSEIIVSLIVGGILGLLAETAYRTIRR